MGHTQVGRQQTTTRSMDKTAVWVDTFKELASFILGALGVCVQLYIWSSTGKVEPYLLTFCGLLAAQPEQIVDWMKNRGKDG